MIEFLSYADKFYQALVWLGSWLFDTTLADLLDAIYANPSVSPTYSTLLTRWLADQLGIPYFSHGIWDLLGIYDLASSVSLASFICGSGLLFILVYKLITFLLDVVT